MDLPFRTSLRDDRTDRDGVMGALLPSTSIEPRERLLTDTADYVAEAQFFPAAATWDDGAEKAGKVYKLQ